MCRCVLFLRHGFNVCFYVHDLIGGRPIFLGSCTPISFPQQLFISVSLLEDTLQKMLVKGQRIFIMDGLYLWGWTKDFKCMHWKPVVLDFFRISWSTSLDR